MEHNKFINIIQEIVNTTLDKKGLSIDEWHLGKVVNVNDNATLDLYIDGNREVTPNVPCNPNYVFSVGDYVWVQYINRNPNNAFVPFRRAIGGKRLPAVDTNFYSHTHNLADLAEKSYNSLTDKPFIPSTPEDIGAEPAFVKNTAFNKDFGNTAGTVAEGNHTHSGLHTHSNLTLLEKLTQSGTEATFNLSDFELKGHTHSYLPLIGGTIDGLTVIKNDSGIDVTNTGPIKALQIYQPTAGADALMTFHVAGDHACHFGLAGDINDLVVGGWSKGANRYRIWHEGNFDPLTKADVGHIHNELHTHTNKTILDKITQSGAETEFDLSNFELKGHSHVRSDITDFAHSHTKSDITDFTHTHTENEISDLDKYTQAEVNNLLAEKSDTTHTHSELHTHNNKSVLDKITQTGIESSFDLSNFELKGHTHIKADITDFSHTHTKSDITDFSHVHDDLYLSKTNTTSYTPSSDYHPATKKYVDDAIINAGGGDMMTTVYDTDGDGIVDRAELADSVDWTNITNKPSTFTPSTHTHTEADITDLGDYLPKSGGTISNDLIIQGNGLTIGNTNLSNAWLLLGDTFTGLGFDENEIVSKGTGLNITTGDNNPIRMKVNALEIVTINSTDVNINKPLKIGNFKIEHNTTEDSLDIVYVA